MLHHNIKEVLAYLTDLHISLANQNGVCAFEGTVCMVLCQSKCCDKSQISALFCIILSDCKTKIKFQQEMKSSYYVKWLPHTCTYWLFVHCICLCRLNPSTASVASPLLLRMFLSSIFINVDVSIREGSIYCDKLCDEGPYYSGQVNMPPSEIKKKDNFWCCDVIIEQIFTIEGRKIYLSERKC